METLGERGTNETNREGETRTSILMVHNQTMSWIKEINLTWTQMMAIKVLNNGPVPKHLCILMDGNRRYAKANGMSRLTGQMKGCELVMNVYQWCMALGISVVTIYGFSARNLERSEEEVGDIWRMTEKMFEDLLGKRELLKEWGLRIRVTSESSKVPKHVQILFAKIMMATKDNDKRVLNFALAYTSTHEITQTVKDIAEGVGKGQILPEDVNEDLVSKCLYTGDLPEPDLIIRTSGEVRLSEFFLWRTTSSCLYFTKVLWPAFGIWDFMAAVFHYQRCYADLEEVKRIKPSLKLSNNNSKAINFVNELHKLRKHTIEKISALGLMKT